MNIVSSKCKPSAHPLNGLDRPFKLSSFLKKTLIEELHARITESFHGYHVAPPCFASSMSLLRQP
jgi:UDP-N-acetylglucosamine:LPS N-acetylglucosamine transferase